MLDIQMWTAIDEDHLPPERRDILCADTLGVMTVENYWAERDYTLPSRANNFAPVRIYSRNGYPVTHWAELPPKPE